MTDNKAFKKRVRARAAKTGERYTTARATLASPAERRGNVSPSPRLIALANEEARIHRHPALHPLHLLLALLDEGGEALRVLERLHVSPVAVRNAVEADLARHMAEQSTWLSPSAPPTIPIVTDETRDVLARAGQVDLGRTVSASLALLTVLVEDASTRAPLAAFGATEARVMSLADELGRSHPGIER